MIPSITVRCPSCDARIKAPMQLLGQWRACPGSSCRFVVRPHTPEDQAPVLVGDVHSALEGATSRRSAFSGAEAR